MLAACALFLVVSTVLPTYEYSAVHEPMWYGGILWPILVGLSGIVALAAAVFRPLSIKRAGQIGGLVVILAVLLGGFSAGHAYAVHDRDALAGGSLLISGWPVYGAWLAITAALVMLLGGTSKWQPTTRRADDVPGAPTAMIRDSESAPVAILECNTPLPALNEVVGPESTTHNARCVSDVADSVDLDWPTGG
ncbi:MAG TPA: hypothetical protein VFA16_05475 [Mycobacterium sp.]|uniref:hypothetical protein n=1 Tax=Mycobacterium sp. TaxID=1785 RepID=UPI002D729EFB|nr:hypothetical protein [Mycobacterium sp.]HZU46696.1 hypothetical protein [Mycobacterium sp.]